VEREASGLGPLPLLEDDRDLVPLLRLAPAEMLDPIVEYIRRKGGLTAQLHRTDRFRRFEPNHTIYADDISAEIQKFGANTLVSHTFRHGKGVYYQEILKDIANKLDIRRKGRSVEKLETAIAVKLMSEAFEKLDPRKQRELLDSLQVRNYSGAGLPASAAIAQLLVNSSGFTAYKVTVIVANAIAQATLNHGLTFAANAALTKGLSLFAGPLGWALDAFLVANIFASPAYRVTIPCIIQVALIRKYQKAVRRQQIMHLVSVLLVVFLITAICLGAYVWWQKS
jgi:uncharacterized protein YaaW (UPF0174 family)